MANLRAGLIGLGMMGRHHARNLRAIDGVDLVAVFLVGRQDIKGGETRVFEANGPSGQRFTLTEPWSLLLLDDARMVHESTPIQPTAAHGHRDTLVVTCRAGGFQGDGDEAQPT